MSIMEWFAIQLNASDEDVCSRRTKNKLFSRGNMNLRNLKHRNGGHFLNVQDYRDFDANVISPCFQSKPTFRVPGFIGSFRGRKQIATCRDLFVSLNIKASKSGTV